MPIKPEGPKPTRPEIQLLRDEVSKRIEEDEASAYSEFIQKVLAVLPDRAAYEQALLEYFIERFNIHARWHCFLVYNQRGVKEFYEPYLTKLITQVIKWASKKTSQSSKADTEKFRRTLRAHLIGRKHHWKSEAMKRARNFETGESAEVPPEPVLVDTPPEEAVADSGDRERERRAELLRQYKAATGDPSNKRIYEAKNSGIYKPDFYAWLKADLSSESAMSINFERFLRLKKPPIPRKPRD